MPIDPQETGGNIYIYIYIYIYCWIWTKQLFISKVFNAWFWFFLASYQCELERKSKRVIWGFPQILLFGRKNCHIFLFPHIQKPFNSWTEWQSDRQTVNIIHVLFEEGVILQGWILEWQIWTLKCMHSWSSKIKSRLDICHFKKK